MRTRTDELVSEIFALTKQKLSSDDPLLAVILLQEHSLQQALEQQNTRCADQDQAFFAQFDERQTQINAMYSELVQYRERVVAELLAKNQQIAIHIEDRVQRKVQGNIRRLRRQLVVSLMVVIMLAGIGSVLTQMGGW